MSGRAGMVTRSELICGTVAGYERHCRRGEPVDDACRAAQDTRSERRGRPLPDPIANGGFKPCRRRACVTAAAEEAGSS